MDVSQKLRPDHMQKFVLVFCEKLSKIKIYTIADLEA